MEDRYYSRFKKLNWLLAGSFEAERVYYNASEDVQEVNLKRFFNHESVNRNRFSHQISEQLVQAGIEPMKMWVEKGNLDRDWKAEKKALTKPRPLKLLNKCITRDKENLELYDQIIEENQLNEEVIKLLKKQRKVIRESLEKAEKFRTCEINLEPGNKPKVRKLKAI